jgi:glycerate kinase
MLGPVSHLVAAPDKFRGTATAPEIAAAAASVAVAAGWTADEVPMADGGEGMLEAVHGDMHRTTVAGPLGAPTEAEWRMVAPTEVSPGRTAVLESAQAVGRFLLPSPTGEDPVRASTTGVGQLILAAVDAGATRVVLGVGGTSTTDGGWGAVEAIGGPERMGGAELVVACDVVTPFRRAAEVFGPQKGATPAQVLALTTRLDDLAERYRQRFGIDVGSLPGAGAAGGLAGGLAAVGARLVPGFDLVAELVGLEAKVARADLVVTGEGRLDPTSFEGKVVGGVVDLVAGRVPVLCVVGDADSAVLAGPPGATHDVEVVSLTERFGARRARGETAGLVAAVVAERLAAAPSPG